MAGSSPPPLGDSRYGQRHLVPIVGTAVMPDGGGHDELAADGGIFAFGDAPLHSSKGGNAIDGPIVGVTS